MVSLRNDPGNTQHCDVALDRMSSCAVLLAVSLADLRTRLQLKATAFDAEEPLKHCGSDVGAANKHAQFEELYAGGRGSHSPLRL